MKPHEQQCLYCIYCGNYFGEDAVIAPGTEASYCQPLGTCTTEEDDRGPSSFNSVTGDVVARASKSTGVSDSRKRGA